MQPTKLISVSLAKGGSNYSGYTATGDRIFIPGRQIEALGLTKDTLPKEMFALVGTKEFSEVDPVTKKPTEKTFVRTQTLSIFLTKEEMFAAKNDSRLLNDECEAAYIKQASAAGLTTETVNALENAAI